jgi:molybdopterin synthase catalytic subunit
MKLYEVFHTHGRIVAFMGQPRDESKARVVDLTTGKHHIIPKKVLETAVQMTRAITD